MMSATVDMKAKPAAAPVRRGRLPKEEVDRRIEHLLEVALDEFALNGFAGTSLDRLVERSGVSKTTMLRRFESKEGMFRTLVDRHVREIRAKLSEVVLDIDDPEGTITRFVRHYIDSAIDRPAGHLLTAISVAEKTTVPGLGAMLLASSDEGMAPIVDYIGQLMTRGILRRADPREVSYDLQALMSHGFRVMVDDRAFLRREGRDREIARRFLKGWS